MAEPIYKELEKHLQSRDRYSDGDLIASVALFRLREGIQCDVLKRVIHSPEAHFQRPEERTDVHIRRRARR